MSLYPSLEDMKVDQMVRAQMQASQPQGPAGDAPQSAQAALPYPVTPTSMPAPEGKYNSLYPVLDEYMGLSLSPEAVAAHMPNVVAVPQSRQVAVPDRSTAGMVAPISGESLGLKRAAVSHGIREVILCKDKNGKVGMRLESINKGVFVVLVQAGSPAALAGLRFGDQVLQINDVIVAGYSMDKVHDLIRKASPQRIVLAVRDRPFERTVTMHKDSVGHIGFGFKNGKINTLVADSSAARNGLLTEHHLLEVNGQNVVGMKDDKIRNIIDAGGKVITVTIMPSYIYDHMMKFMAGSLVKKLMDHSVPDL